MGDYNLIGRDKFLEKKMYAQVKGKKSFYIEGRQGVGKTEIFTWAFDHWSEEKKVLIDPFSHTYSSMIKEIAQAMEITVSKKKNLEIEKEIIMGGGATVFIDNCERLTPKQINFFKSLSKISSVNLCGKAPFKDDLKALLWGKNRFIINPISKKHRKEMAEYIIRSTGSKIDLDLLANESYGLPARAWALARGEYHRNSEQRTNDEEMNIAPLLLLLASCGMGLRYIALGLGERDIYVMAGIFMAVFSVLKIMINEMKKKN